MCAIVGFLKRQRRLDILDSMLQIQSHRGPDHKGIFFDEQTGVHLGHNRLAVLDLTDAGHQPMFSECGNYVIVYNGEVYNFKKIRRDLKAKGYKFSSNTDTEVVLKSYIEWGTNAVHKFRGMFAFAILDKINNRLVLIRDRAGVKPLYYYPKK